MDYEIATYILAIISIILCLGIGSFITNLHSATYWIGKKIAPIGSEKELPRGFQDAITPSRHAYLYFFTRILYLIILILGSIKLWYLGILLVLVIAILTKFLGELWPNNINFYLKILIRSMTNRMADYSKKGDFMRSDAAKEMLEKMENLYVEIRDENLIIPDFMEIRNMRSGTLAEDVRF